MQKNRIIPQMFDVRPVDETGDLDWRKIHSIGEKLGQELIDEKTLLRQKKEKERLEKIDRQKVFFQAIAENKRLAELKADELREAERRRQAEILTEKITSENKRRDQMQAALKIQQEKTREAAAVRYQQELEQSRKLRIEKKIKSNELEALLAKRIEEKKQHESMERFKRAQKLPETGRLKRNSSGKNFTSGFSWSGIFSSRLVLNLNDNSLAAFAIVAVVLSLSLGGISYASKGLGLKGRVLGVSTDGYENLTGAMKDMSNQNFESSSAQFSQALENFSQGSEQLEDMGGVLIDATKYVPFASRVFSGKNAVEAGKHFSEAGQAINEVVKVASSLKNPIDASAPNNVSLLDVLKSAQINIAKAKLELDGAQKNIDEINIDDLPKDKQEKFLLLKQKLPDIRKALDLFLNNSNILYELLGGNGPRKYLFLFQNNSEMRATGGFIGSYGLLDIANGHVKKFFIDGIFNPDGQLRDKIVPPSPIQKISANWSMHDSNWFADFPRSAQKAIYFYEKTGGPTADGVITLTPTLMQKLLEITGPIEMPEYEVTLDSNNFIELTQYKVEVDYDKQENKPKKILSDLAPLVLDKLLSSRDLESVSKMANAIMAGLQEKHVLFYSENDALQKMISEQGWSGEILPAAKDYVSVINTNINGYKTDAIVQESISHKAEIQADGKIVDTLTITRKHNGGGSQYEWLNKVNADYMRVYVPEGSKLLEVSGQSREVNKEPLDYDALGFKRDDDVQKEQLGIVIDPESGTRVYSESGKTVFANWVYVSPGESVTVTYKYLLPFALFNVTFNDESQIDSYSLVAQKQSGSVGSGFSSSISYPSDYEVKWNFPSSSEKTGNEIRSESILKTDKFEGILFEKN